MARSLPEIAQAATGTLTAVTALGAAIAQLTEQLDGLHRHFQNPATVWLVWAAAAIALLIGLSLLRRGLSRKSRLLKPEALLIDPDNPGHLRGRTEEIARLTDAVANWPLVFLEGESGSGKSSLVRSGLIPALRRDGSAPSVLPIYVNAYPGDWQDGLAAQLATAAWRDLGSELRERLGIETLAGLRRRLFPAPDDEDTPGLYQQIRDELGLTPLLIFDQFDDYQLVHRGRFLRQGRWITPDILTAENDLWRALRDDLRDRGVHLLIITRRELFSGLEAVRFEQPDTPFLDRVEPAHITALLEQMVANTDGAAVIAHPEAGWEALKDRLIRDLSSQGRILPIQARVVFKGLIDLPYLSIGAYERQGGIEGLQAGYIEDAMGAAARAAGLVETRVLSVLLQLVDETDPELPKARTAATGALVEAAQAEYQTVIRVLDALKREGGGPAPGYRRGARRWGELVALSRLPRKAGPDRSAPGQPLAATAPRPAVRVPGRHRLAGAQAEAVARALIGKLAESDDTAQYRALPQALVRLEVPVDANRVDTALDLLQAPLAHGDALRLLLRYCSRVAGLTGQSGFETTDDFVEWARDNRADLGLERRPKMPPALVR